MKNLKIATAMLLLFSVVLLSAGCSGNAVLEYLDYGTGINEDGSHNTELYMKNGNDTIGADPGCFYVSPEEDAQYGGYYYMYITGYDLGIAIKYKDEYKDAQALAYRCYRSVDLCTWELCGAVDGFSLIVDKDDWCDNSFWAPEVIRNPVDGKFYMYFSANYDLGLEGEGLCTTNQSLNDRITLGVAVSDSPVGPFDVINDIDKTTGNKVPTINVRKGCRLPYDFGIIDASPFFDDDGTLYLYFAKTGGHYSELKGNWGVKMKTMTEPDYSTLTCQTQVGVESVTNTPGTIDTVKVGAAYYDATEGTVNEAPFMLKHNGKYYLTYSSHGYGDPAYSVHQAVSDNPLSGFVKVGEFQGNPVLNGAIFGYSAGTGHHCFVRNADDNWIVYHRHDSIYAFRDRVICADRVNFVKNADGMEVLTANGPTFGLQWRSEDVSDYANLAKEAKITISGADGAEYLNDEILPFYYITQEMKVSFDKEITITLKWDQPVDVNAVMIYNSNIEQRAFSKVADIRFKTTEQRDGKTVYKVIKDLQFPDRYYDEFRSVYMISTPAVADFDTITVTELTITMSASDAMLDTSSEGLDISEIVVLGGKTNG